MILVTRLNGPAFALNPDLVERAEGTPDTVVTLVSGNRLTVQETPEEISDLVRDFRQSLHAQVTV